MTELIYIDTDYKNETEKLFLDISNFKYLKRLQIERCSIEEFKPKLLSPELEELNLESNLLTDLKDIEFTSEEKKNAENVANPSKKDISNTAKNQIYVPLKKCPKLIKIYLSSNQISEFPFKALRNLIRL